MQVLEELTNKTCRGTHTCSCCIWCNYGLGVWGGVHDYGLGCRMMSKISNFWRVGLCWSEHHKWGTLTCLLRTLGESVVAADKVDGFMSLLL